MWDPQAIELLALCLAAGVFLAVVLIIINCITSCYHNCKRSRKKSDVERLPDTYVDEIKRLLERHKKVMEEYDSPKNEYDFPSSGMASSEEKYRDDDSEVTTPARSRSNSVKLRKIKEELSEFREEFASDEEEAAKRRTWGGLCDSVFDPVPLPSPATDAECQTTATLDRMRSAVKIETTV